MRPDPVDGDTDARDPADEAHDLSATFLGREIMHAKRLRPGQRLGGLTEHLLLTTATPRSGKEEDFRCFMALLDGGRLAGRFRGGVHAADVSDLKRRTVEEKLLKFDVTPLFPERIADTVTYRHSHREARLYKDVIECVRERFNRTDALRNDERCETIGFALTIIQRRLASVAGATESRGCRLRLTSQNEEQIASQSLTVT